MSTVFEPAYQAYKADVKNVVPRHKRPGPNAFVAGDFDGFARLMLVVILANGLTHWVMARRWQNGVSVMNPDGGTESSLPNFLTWMNAPAGTPLQIGNVTYTFTGIVLSVVRSDRGG